MKKAIILIVFTFGFNLVGFSQKTLSDQPLSNPSFMYGTSLGEYLQTLYRLGKYDEMMKFTSKETIDKYGQNKVRAYYENCGFGYKLKINNKSQEGKYIILYYNASIIATNKVVKIKCVVENDTSKIVLDNLNIIYK